MKGKNNGAALARKSSKEVGRSRDTIMRDIKVGWEQFLLGIEQVERQYKFGLGRLYVELRETFPKGEKGDEEFNDYCRNCSSPLKQIPRNEWMRYYIKLRPKIAKSPDLTLPPLRSVTRGKPEWRTRDELRRRIEESLKNQKRFEIERQEKEKERKLIHQLAMKIIEAGYRALSVKMHPDHGGTKDGQRRLVEARDLLKEQMTVTIVAL